MYQLLCQDLRAVCGCSINTVLCGAATQPSFSGAEVGSCPGSLAWEGGAVVSHSVASCWTALSEGPSSGPHRLGVPGKMTVSELQSPS